MTPRQLGAAVLVAVASMPATPATAQTKAPPPVETSAPAPAGDAANGKVLYGKIGCYQCHGREGQGSTATGPRLNQNPITYARFVSYLRKPAGEMPPYTAKVVSDQEAADLFVGDVG